MPTPRSRTDFWEQKFECNVERDARQTAELEAAGWTVMTLWECETRETVALAAFLDAIAERVAR